MVVSGLVSICSYLVFGLDMCCGVDKVIITHTVWYNRNIFVFTVS